MACRKMTPNLNIMTKPRSKMMRIRSVRPITARKCLEIEAQTGLLAEKAYSIKRRFTNATSYIDVNWGHKMVGNIPPKECTESIVFCDGGPLGHPKVCINLDKPGSHICEYCGRRFVKKGH